MKPPAWVEYWAGILGLAAVALGLIGWGSRLIYLVIRAWLKFERTIEQVEDLDARVDRLEETRCRSSGRTPRDK